MPSPDENEIWLCVVARNSALAVALSAGGFDVETTLPDEEREWLEAVGPETVVLLQGESAEWTAQTVNQLRAKGLDAPVVAFAADDEYREELVAGCGADPKLTLVGLPLSFDKLVAAVGGAVRAIHASPAGGPVPAPQVADGPVPPVDVPAAGPGPVPAGAAGEAGDGGQDAEPMPFGALSAVSEDRAGRHLVVSAPPSASSAGPDATEAEDEDDVPSVRLADRLLRSPQGDRRGPPAPTRRDPDTPVWPVPDGPADRTEPAPGEPAAAGNGDGLPVPLGRGRSRRGGRDNAAASASLVPVRAPQPPAVPDDETKGGRRKAAHRRGRGKAEPAPKPAKPAPVPKPGKPARGAKPARPRTPSRPDWPEVSLLPADEEHRLAVSLVRRLLPLVGHLQSVPDMSEWVLGAVLSVVPAEASALLLPDDGKWTVQAGTALRPLELRQTLGPSHWLVSQVATDRNALLIEDTDIARIRLQESPLASWRNLLAAPVLEVDGLLLLARNETVFTPTDLTTVVEALSATYERLAQAFEVRELARVLEPLTERFR